MGEPTYDAVGAELVAELTDFTFALRLAGLEVTIERSMSFLRAVAGLGAHDQVQLFWAGRSALCCEPGDFEIYDETFNWFFRQPVPAAVRSPIPRRASVKLVSDLSGMPLAGNIPTPRAATAPPELLRHQELTELDDEERAELAALLRLLDPLPPRRAERPAPVSRLEPARAIRSVVRGGGEIVRRRRVLASRPRTLVVLIDTSGSMAPYAETLLRFAHAARRKLGRGCEVFALGGGLTRLSEVLDVADPERALDGVAAMVPAWSGGTRLGHALRAFLHQHGQRGMARGAVVIVLSDGDEPGNAELLVDQARLLRRLTRSFLWVNPQPASDGFAPVRPGILAIQPFCDHLLAGQSLTALSELMEIAHDA